MFPRMSEISDVVVPDLWALWSSCLGPGDVALRRMDIGDNDLPPFAVILSFKLEGSFKDADPRDRDDSALIELKFL